MTKIKAACTLLDAEKAGSRRKDKDQPIKVAIKKEDRRSSDQPSVDPRSTIHLPLGRVAADKNRKTAGSCRKDKNQPIKMAIKKEDRRSSDQPSVDPRSTTHLPLGRVAADKNRKTRTVARSRRNPKGMVPESEIERRHHWAGNCTASRKAWSQTQRSNGGTFEAQNIFFFCGVCLFCCPEMDAVFPTHKQTMKSLKSGESGPHDQVSKTNK